MSASQRLARKVVIVGSGHAGTQVAVGLRRAGWTGAIVLVDEQEHLPYERPPVSKGHLLGEDPVPPVPLRSPKVFESRGIERIVSALVESIDTARRTVVTSAGPIDYDELVIATGARARTLTVPGADLRGVHTLRTYGHAARLRGELRAGARVVVIGAGYIGLEVAAAATTRGCSVTVAEATDRVLSRVAGPIVSQHMSGVHERHGVRIVTEARVTGLTGTETVSGIALADDSTIPADVVVAGIGVVPNTELAAEAGVEVDDGILVTTTGATSVPHVHAVGDVARECRPDGMRGARWECVSSAVDQADRLVASLVEERIVPAAVPWFWSVQHGVRLQSAGVPTPGSVEVVRGEPSSGSFTVLHLEGDRLVAIDTVNAIADFVPGKKLVHGRALIDPVLASDAGTRLSHTVRSEMKEYA